MIYITEENKGNLKVPRLRLLGVEGNEFEIVLTHLITKEKYTGYNDIQTSVHSYTFDLSECELTDGQYSYIVRENGKEEIIARGLAQYGDYKGENQEYNTDINFVQYNG